MDIQEIIRGLTSQGPVFWTAAASVALGLTMLLVAGIFQVRGISPNLVLDRARKSSAAQVGKRVDVTDTGYQVASGELRAESSSTGSDLSGELTHLLARLKHASTRLQEVHDALPEASAGADQVVLKGTGGGVEYVFKAGVG